jgi:hypothetical protein
VMAPPRINPKAGHDDSIDHTIEIRRYGDTPPRHHGPKHPAV